MITNCLLQRIARLKKRSGFTLVELLVVIAIIAILAGVALGPITNGIKQAKHNAAMQSARTVGQVCFNFATDNTTGGNRYPGGSSASDVCNLLVTTGYATDASIFYVTGQSTGVAPGTATLTKNNVSWCFTMDTAAGTGISSCGDSIPMVFFNNGGGSSPIGVTLGTVPLTGTVGSSAPQGTDGIAVYYKGNNATYIKGVSGVCAGVVPASCSDTGAYKVAP